MKIGTRIGTQMPGIASDFGKDHASSNKLERDEIRRKVIAIEFTAGCIQPPPYRQLSQRELVPGGLCQSFQNPLNRSGASFVYRTVEAIERWPR